MCAAETSKRTILVVDDEQIVHESVKRILEQEAYDVHTAMRVDQALDLLKRYSYDLVLTDLMMPDRSGMDVVEAIARDHPDTGVVMFTGFATVDTAVQSIKLGALDYLPKPFTPDELLETCGRALAAIAKKRSDRELEHLYDNAEKALRSSLDLQEVLGLICSSVVNLFKLKGASVLILRKKDQILELASHYGLSDEYISKGVLSSEKSVAELFEGEQPIQVLEKDFDNRLQFPAEARKEGIASILSIPLKIDNAILGALRIYTSEPRTFSQDEMDFLLKFADKAARALENAMAYHNVRKDIEGLKKYIPASVAKNMAQET
jgi:YesN/AraC family two-component response regulator